MTAQAIETDIPFERERDDQAWARWFARGIDGLLLTPFVFILFAAMGVLIELGRLPPVLYEWMVQPVAAVAMELGARFLLMLLWEPLFLSNTGTTPGKWVFGIRVRRSNGDKLSLLRAVNRFLRVWLIGMGAYVPLLSLVLSLMARARLIGSGSTVWDDQLDCVVQHRQRNPLIWTLAIVLVVGVNAAVNLLARMNQ